ncbi:unnamed protein product [Meloidogyne enterolobii]|uniref:Uncharacterized protein n=1 Tax=Meloidogyne enterolobii TaxID=390850 RepID=A0ACB1B469_MELEN
MCFSFLSPIYISLPKLPKSSLAIPPPFPFHSLHSSLQFIPLPHPLPFLIHFPSSSSSFSISIFFFSLFPQFSSFSLYLFLILPLITLPHFNPLPFKISFFPISTLSKTCPSLSSFCPSKLSANKALH